MYALIIGENVFIFDMTAHYGIHPLIDMNLDGYQVIKDYKEVLEHYEKNYFDSIYKIEQYYDFLFKICVIYVKDLFL